MAVPKNARVAAIPAAGAYNPCMLHALTANLQEALTDRLTLLVNHVLGSEAVATQRLLVHVGRTFGVQFDGWPAVQAVGWPSLAYGTFGGRVVFVDPHDDGKGRFRVLVKQDPDDDPWPSDYSLRQGSRAMGWLLLNRVSLGYELWRRFNGFPASLPYAPGEESGDAKGAAKK